MAMKQKGKKQTTGKLLCTQKRNDNHKAQGVTRGERQKVETRQLHQPTRHFIVVLPRMVTLAAAVTGSERSDLVETLQL